MVFKSDNQGISLEECPTLEFLCGPQSNIIKPWQFTKIGKKESGLIVEIGVFTLLLTVHMDSKN